VVGKVEERGAIGADLGQERVAARVGEIRWTVGAAKGFLLSVGSDLEVGGVGEAADNHVAAGIHRDRHTGIVVASAQIGGPHQAASRWRQLGDEGVTPGKSLDAGDAGWSSEVFLC